MDLFTGHGLVLLAIAREPCSTIRRLSDVTDISERHVMNIVNDLRDAGYLHSSLVGGSNRYRLVLDAPIRNTPGLTVQALLDLVGVPE